LKGIVQKPQNVHFCQELFFLPSPEGPLQKFETFFKICSAEEEKLMPSGTTRG